MNGERVRGRQVLAVGNAVQTGSTTLQVTEVGPAPAPPSIAPVAPPAPPHAPANPPPPPRASPWSVVATGEAAPLVDEQAAALGHRARRAVDRRRGHGRRAGRRGARGLSEELRTAHVVPRILDVSDEAATRVFVEEIQEAIGPIDVFFANVGVSTGGGPGTPDELRVRQWRINVMSHVYAARVLLTGWIERGEGHLVTTASMAGLLSALGDAAYSATKRAAVGFAERLAFTYAGRGCANGRSWWEEPCR